MKVRQFFGFTLPTLSILAFVGLLVFSLAALLKINDVMRVEAPHNMLWVVSQARASALKLEVTASSYVDGETDKLELKRHHQVFLSRLHLLQQGPQQQEMLAMGYAEKLKDLNLNLPAMDELITELQVGDYSALKQLRQPLKSYSKFLGKVANKAMVVSWDNLGQTLDQARIQLWYILAAMVGILLAGLALIWHLLMAIRSSKFHAEAFWREHKNAEMYRNFGAMISHQFRTPLAIIDSSLQRLIRRSAEVTPEEIRQRSNKARQAVARLLQLIESILEAARLEGGQIDSQSNECNVQALVEECCKRAEEGENTGRLVIQKTFTGELIAYCDPVNTEQIIDNLLSNAMKYSPASTPVVVQLQQNKDWVECIVSNQGALGSELKIDNLFKQYVRGKNAEGIKGLGIGLYMAKMLALKQQGDILANEESGYVSFCLRLPRAQEKSL